MPPLAPAGRSARSPLTGAPPIRTALLRAAPLRIALAALVLALLLASANRAWAQPRAELMLGVAGAPVADAWNPVRAVVRDAPGAVLRMEIDAGGLERGEVPQLVTARAAPAGGVQRIDLDLPLPSWRRVSWRIEQGERVLASGGLGARERDDRPLHLVVSARPARWSAAFGPEARVVVASSADLPTRAAGWDGVAALLLDGTAAAPADAIVVTAAAAGVRVLLPTEGPSGYAPLTRLVARGASSLGAGSLEGLSAASLAAGRLNAEPAAAWGREARRAAVAAGAAALPAPTWDHLPKLVVAGAAVGFAALVWTLLWLGGPAGFASAALVLVAASVAVPAAAPTDREPRTQGAVILASNGLGVRTDLIAVARLPEGASQLDGLFASLEPRRLGWNDGRTNVPLPAGGRTRLTGAPVVVTVPDDVREATAATGSDGAPEALRALVPSGGVVVRRENVWWLVHPSSGELAASARGVTHEAAMRAPTPVTAGATP